MFAPRLEVRFWERAQLTADTSAVSLGTINTGDFGIRGQYEYGGAVSLRLGNPDTGSGQVGYNPSTGIGSFTVAGGSGDSATGLRQSLTVTTAGEVSLQSGIGVRSGLGENGVLRIGTSVGYAAATSTFRYSITVGGELLPTPTDLEASVPLAESRARDVVADTGSLAPDVTAIRGFADRHTTARPVDPANPGGATATDFGALGAAGGQLGRLSSVPRDHTTVRGALDFSVGPAASGQTDVRVQLRLQVFAW